MLNKSIHPSGKQRVNVYPEFAFAKWRRKKIAGDRVPSRSRARVRRAAELISSIVEEDRRCRINTRGVDMVPEGNR